MKVIDESRRKKKKKSEFGWFYQLSPGNPEYNMNAFNHSMDVGSVPTSGSMGESLDEAIQKNIYEITYIDSNDNSTRAYVEAYSEKQAALVLRKETKVYKIVNIDCIEDHSKDDGEQLSMFGEQMKFKIVKDMRENLDSINESINKKIKEEFKAVSGIDLIGKGVATHYLLYNPEIVVFIDASYLGSNNIQNSNFIHVMLHFIQRTHSSVSVSNIGKVKFYFYNRETKEFEANIDINRVLFLTNKYAASMDDVTVKEKGI